MGAVTGPPMNDWEDVVSEATEHVKARGSAVAAATERQKPKAQGPKIAILSVLLVAAVGFDIWMWTRLPEPMSAAEERGHMAWVIVDVVETIEDFRSEEGRWPSEAELSDVLSEDMSYQLVGDRYSVTVIGDAGAVTFDGADNVQAWAQNAWSVDAVEAGS